MEINQSEVEQNTTFICLRLSQTIKEDTDTDQMIIYRNMWNIAYAAQKGLKFL